MRCSVDSADVKYFAQLAKCAERIGEELFIEARGDVFRNDFFDSFESEDSAPIKAKVLTKAFLSAFRSVQTVQRLHIRLDQREERFVIEMFCRHDIRKKYALVYEKCEILHAMFERREQQTRLRCSPRLLLDSLQNFSATLEEISLVIAPQRFMLRSFVDDAEKKSSSPITELSMKTSDFSQYHVEWTRRHRLTFAQRELKAILSFCEALEADVEIRSDGTGRPLLMTALLKKGESRGVSIESIIATVAHTDEEDGDDEHDGAGLCSADGTPKPGTASLTDPRTQRGTASRPLQATESEAAPLGSARSALQREDRARKSPALCVPDSDDEAASDDSDREVVPGTPEA